MIRLPAAGGSGHSVLGISGNLRHRLAMSTLTVDLQTTVEELDSDSATKLERLVRDAMALARPVRTGHRWRGGGPERLARGTFRKVRGMPCR